MTKKLLTLVSILIVVVGMLTGCCAPPPSAEPTEPVPAEGQNLILALIDGRLARAALHTGWPYNVGFAVGLVIAFAFWRIIGSLLQGVNMVIDDA